jgi:hypothetical protein
MEIFFDSVVSSNTESRIGLHNGESLLAIAKKLELAPSLRHFLGPASDARSPSIFEASLRSVNYQSHPLYSVALFGYSRNADSRS